MKASLLLALAYVGFTAAPSRAVNSPALVVHEWGTFTSVQGADGVQINWNPLTQTDLPSFVYDPLKLAASGCTSVEYPGKAGLSARIRMETPVLYFYSTSEMTVDVRVDFPGGRITEWYPRASQIGPYLQARPGNDEPRRSFLEWNDVRILSPGTTEISANQLIREGEASHYYAARNTAANLLKIEPRSSGTNPEYERLLFYRGVGDFQAPLEVKVGPGERQLQLSTPGPEPLMDLFVLEIAGGGARYRHLAMVSAAEPQAVDLSAVSSGQLPQVRSRVMDEVKAALVIQGLYAEEAAAMVSTWQDQWFSGEGARVLYLLPRAWTDRALPLTVNPLPQKLARIMVGRSEVILPETQRELHRQLVRYSAADKMTGAGAVAAVRRLGLGRFLEPAIALALRDSEKENLADAGWKLAKAAAEENSHSPTPRVELTDIELTPGTSSR